MRKRAKVKLTVIFCWLLAWGGCTTSQVAPLIALPETPPGYVHVPHPEGLDYGDLLAVFTDRGAPSVDSVKACDEDFRKLNAVTNSREEVETGAREFVRLDPVKYHWCFYGKILEMEDHLKKDSFIDEKQKAVIDAYVFLTPMARAFLVEYQDSRYLRWASSRYRRASEFVFYRRVELTEQASAELLTSTNPFGLLRTSEAAPRGVLEKYGIVRATVTALPPETVGLLPSPVPAPAIAAQPVTEPVREPAREPAAQPSAAIPDVGPSATPAVTPK